MDMHCILLSKVLQQPFASPFTADDLYPLGTERIVKPVVIRNPPVRKGKYSHC
ncbi:hypothetical protein SAMN05216303_10965 [Rhodoferax sp. OV413]|nr:hypothetical protein SAMN05216303_10965 [Rhodoferax sp. OV413]